MSSLYHVTSGSDPFVSIDYNSHLSKYFGFARLAKTINLFAPIKIYIFALKYIKKRIVTNRGMVLL